MRRILIDTSFYAAFKRNHPEAIKIIQNATGIFLNAVVLAELYTGFKLGSKERKNLLELEQFFDSPRVSILPITEETAEFYASIFARLKKKGSPLPVHDIWIAASAMEHGLYLVSFDLHFERIDGLMFRGFLPSVHE